MQGSTSTTTDYVYDGDGPHLIEEVDSSGNAIARYVYGKRIDEPLGQLRSGVTSYDETDGMGSVTSLSSASGAIAQTYTFDSFGNQIASSGSLTNPFRYTGREFDMETNLYFYRARYYDSTAGKFVSEDPLRFGAGDVNFYDYVGGNPINYRDPSGQTSIPIIIHGNWCGPNWTGHQFEEYNPAHAKLYRQPIDAADAVCKQHDICYYQCRVTHSCDAGARSNCMRTICDATLMLEMPSTGWGPIIAAGIDFLNEHPDAGPNAPNCPTCKAPAAQHQLFFVPLL
jgi:RHS repeat-associated protein